MKRLIRRSNISSSIDFSDLQNLPEFVENYGGYEIRKEGEKYSIWIDHEYYGDSRSLEDAELIVDCLNDDSKVAASKRINRKKSRITASKDLIGEYSKVFKKYPALSRMVSTGGESYYTITETITRYEIGDNGKFKEVSNETSEIPIEYYMNVIDGVSFFRGLGGKETITKGYIHGMDIPVKVTSTSPDGRKKSVRTYNFTYND
jgi:hypothetical protein